MNNEDFDAVEQRASVLEAQYRVWVKQLALGYGSVAFTAAALMDWATFSWLRGSWLFRANGSNVASAAVDSILFPTIAFGVPMPQIVLAQFAAKVVGGAVWAYLLRTFTKVEA